MFSSPCLSVGSLLTNIYKEHSSESCQHLFGLKDLKQQSWNFKSMSAATVTAEARTSAANKTWIFKRKIAVVIHKH